MNNYQWVPIKKNRHNNYQQILNKSSQKYNMKSVEQNNKYNSGKSEKKEKEM